jgi:hypothetical protein
MSARVRIVLTAVAALSASACGLPGAMTLQGSGTAATQDFDVDGFKAVEANGAFRVKITRGDEFAVSVTTDDNILEFVRVVNDGGTLTLDVDRGGKPFGISPKVGLTAEITMPSLEGVTLNGACTASFEGFKRTKAFKVQLAGASTLKGELTAGKLDVDSSGASTVTLRGKADDGAIEASGASHLRLGDLDVERADVHLSGASSCAVRVGETLDYDLSGASHLEYRGDPSIGKREANGASSATQK